MCGIYLVCRAWNYVYIYVCVVYIYYTWSLDLCSYTYMCVVYILYVETGISLYLCVCGIYLICRTWNYALSGISFVLFNTWFQTKKACCRYIEIALCCSIKKFVPVHLTCVTQTATCMLDSQVCCSENKRASNT